MIQIIKINSRVAQVENLVILTVVYAFQSKKK